jgi:OFA family oxalate/formate antiporter-like MFS transporter
MSEQSNARGWLVTFSGTAVNLCLGVLYTWSVFAKQLSAPADKGGWGWTAFDASLPYAIACGVFAIIMVFAGRVQDKIGPRWVITAGGVVVGIGMVLSSFASPDSMTLMVIGFGILVGTGIGFGYASTTPPAVKWFPPSRRGQISGLVVAGFGLASVYASPLANTMLKSFGISNTFLYLGIGFLIAIVLLAQLLKNPPAGYIPPGMPAVGSPKHIPAGHQYDWHEMMKTPQFYLLWLMFGFGSFAGLMMISSMAKIAAQQLPGINLGFILVAFLAIGNAGGRIIAGLLSDKMGRMRTILLIASCQAVMMFLFKYFTTAPVLVLGAILVGAFYGANLAVFPSVTGDYYGTKNLGVNYGLVFTSWGVGGVFGGMVAGKIFDMTNSYDQAFLVAVVICVLQAALSFLCKAPKTISLTHEQQAAVNIK